MSSRRSLIALVPTLLARAPASARTRIDRLGVRLARCCLDRERAGSYAKAAMDIIAGRVEALGPLADSPALGAMVATLEDDEFLQELLDGLWLDRCCVEGLRVRRTSLANVFAEPGVRAALRTLDHDEDLLNIRRKTGAMGPRRAARAIVALLVGAPDSWVRDLITEYSRTRGRSATRAQEETVSEGDEGP